MDEFTIEVWVKANTYEQMRHLERLTRSMRKCYPEVPKQYRFILFLYNAKTGKAYRFCKLLNTRAAGAILETINEENIVIRAAPTEN